jgi:uncharacterized Zn-binding protein involved in type VI secretion
MKPAARTTDAHTCPAHSGGPIAAPGARMVLMGGLPAAHLATPATCVGPLDAIVQGAAMVLINNRPASRTEDLTVHTGKVAAGLGSVLIGGDPYPPNDRLMLALSITKAGGRGDAVDVALVVEQLAKLPADQLQILKDAGVSVIACRGTVTDYRTDLKGVHPRGWPPGATWDKVPGAYTKDRKEVVIGTIGQDSPDGPHVPETGEGHGSVNLVDHEAEHAVDHATGGSASAEFNKARDKDKSTLPAYETQEGRAGQEENFAESGARYYGGDPNDAKKHPNLHDYWKSDPLHPRHR